MPCEPMTALRVLASHPGYLCVMCRRDRLDDAVLRRFGLQYEVGVGPQGGPLCSWSEFALRCAASAVSQLLLLLAGRHGLSI